MQEMAETIISEFQKYKKVLKQKEEGEEIQVFSEFEESL